MILKSFYKHTSFTSKFKLCNNQNITEQSSFICIADVFLLWPFSHSTHNIFHTTVKHTELKWIYIFLCVSVSTRYYKSEVACTSNILR
jgi:hypothetical protein